MNATTFTLAPDDFTPFGHALNRPECVWISGSDIWVSDSRGGVARLDGAGRPQLLGKGIGEPNGFSRRPDGSFVVAGLTDGLVHHIALDGTTRVLLSEVGGRPLGAVNCVTTDGPDRLWISIMSRSAAWYEATRTKLADGCIIRYERGIGEIVADGLNLANEVKVSPDGRHLYVAETGAKCISRFLIAGDGALGAKEPFGLEDLGFGAYVDGFSFDPSGNIWVTVMGRNGLVVITPDEQVHSVYEDVQPQGLEALVRSIEVGTFQPSDFLPCIGPGPVKIPTSIAFSHDGQRAFLGSLAVSHLLSFAMPMSR